MTSRAPDTLPDWAIQEARFSLHNVARDYQARRRHSARFGAAPRGREWHMLEQAAWRDLLRAYAAEVARGVVTLHPHKEDER